MPLLKKKRIVTQRSNDRSFPVLLHQILSNRRFNYIISWLPHGRSWLIHQPELFEKEIIPSYFRHRNLSSFMRQVNGWGFIRVSKGTGRNSYYHTLFLRGRPKICRQMRRAYNANTKLSKPNSDDEPNFYHLSQNDPLPEDSPAGLEILPLGPGANRNDQICSQSSLGMLQRSMTLQASSTPGLIQTPLSYCEDDFLRRSLLVKNDFDIQNAVHTTQVSNNPIFMNHPSNGNILKSYASNMCLPSIRMPIDYFQQKLHSTQKPSRPLLGSSLYSIPRPFLSSNSRGSMLADILRLKHHNALLESKIMNLEGN